MVWVLKVFTENRERLIEHEAVAVQEHFSVNGTLIKARAGHKSIVRKDGKDEDDGGDFRGKSRSNETHESSRFSIEGCLAKAKRPASYASWTICCWRTAMRGKNLSLLGITRVVMQYVND